MKKLKLELDNLAVETFAIESAEGDTGTVHGHISLACTGHPDGSTCNGTATCAGDTCDGAYTCNYQSCDINCTSYKCDDTVIVTGC